MVNSIQEGDVHVPIAHQMNEEVIRGGAVEQQSPQPALRGYFERDTSPWNTWRVFCVNATNESKESVRLPAERSVISLGYNVDTPIPQGSYYVVWCISLSSMDPALLKLIRATSRVFRPNGSDEYNDEIDSDEAAFLQQASRDSSSGALRLRIPSRISIPESLESADLSLFIELEDSLLTDEMLNVCFVDVHYVDLVSANVDGTNGTFLHLFP
ncbi:MAG: hypothetical protein BYD32DRAFT_263840 [Podila humilis]|nr:MAG: hypothetical protein BYD32DRAFT_263840 [Podila humilis]